MSVTDLFRAMPDPADAPVTASPSPVSDIDDPSDLARPGIRIENLGPKDVTVTVGDHPVLAWIDASTKKVASFGPDELASTRALTVPSGGALDYRTTGYDPTDHCAVSDDGSTLPPGLYDLVVYTRIPEGAADGEPGKLVSFGADPGPDRTTTVTNQGLMLDGTLDAPDSCAPDAHGAYTQHLPAGDYWIAFYVRLTTTDGGHVWLADGGAMGVTVDAEGVVAQH